MLPAVSCRSKSPADHLHRLAPRNCRYRSVSCPLFVVLGLSQIMTTKKLLKAGNVQILSCLNKRNLNVGVSFAFCNIIKIFANVSEMDSISLHQSKFLNRILIRVFKISLHV